MAEFIQFLSSFDGQGTDGSATAEAVEAISAKQRREEQEQRTGLQAEHSCARAKLSSLMHLLTRYQNRLAEFGFQTVKVEKEAQDLDEQRAKLLREIETALRLGSQLSEHDNSNTGRESSTLQQIKATKGLVQSQYPHIADRFLQADKRFSKTYQELRAEVDSIEIYGDTALQSRIREAQDCLRSRLKVMLDVEKPDECTVEECNRVVPKFAEVVFRANVVEWASSRVQGDCKSASPQVRRLQHRPRAHCPSPPRLTDDNGVDRPILR